MRIKNAEVNNISVVLNIEEENYYNCFCGKKYKNLSSLSRHKAQVHPKKKNEVIMVKYKRQGWYLDEDIKSEVVCLWNSGYMLRGISKKLRLDKITVKKILIENNKIKE